MKSPAALPLIVLVFIAASKTALACGSLHAIEGHDNTQSTYSVAGPVDGAKGVLLLLAGGGGYLKLDADGCPQKLKGNSLVRKRPLFHDAGYMTVLLDAPSDHHGKEGLGGFRIAREHAADIGRVVATLRQRWNLPVWLIGTSRGAISVSNAASRLTGENAPDGLILTSPVTSGREGGYKAWVAQTVFSLDLERIRIPVLVVVHAADKCIRTPPEHAGKIVDRTAAEREQVAIVTGGPGWSGGTGVKACRGEAPHGFIR